MYHAGDSGIGTQNAADIRGRIPLIYLISQINDMLKALQGNMLYGSPYGNKACSHLRSYGIGKKPVLIQKGFPGKRLLHTCNIGGRVSIIENNHRDIRLPIGCHHGIQI